MAAHTFSPSLTVTAVIRGSLVSKKSEYFTIDDEVRIGGSRRVMPLIAYARNVSALVEVGGVPLGRAFIISDAFSDTSGFFYECGAGPGYIGYKIGATLASVRYVFRKPEPYEAIWYHPERCLYRYKHDANSGTWAWERYRSLPQRALDGTQVFEAFDPDKVYDFYAAMLGAMQSQLHIDLTTLSYMFDPNRVPDDFLYALAVTLDADYDESYGEAQKRAALAISVPAGRVRGLDGAAAVKLLASGYTATVYENADKMEWPQLITDNVNIRFTANPHSGFNSQGFDGTFDIFAGTAYFYQYAIPEAGSWFEVTDTTYGTQRFYFDSIPVGMPAGIIVPVARTYEMREQNSAVTMDAVRSAVNAWRPAVAGYAQIAGPYSITRQHGYNIDVPRGRFPSRFLTVIVTDLHDNPVLDLTKRDIWRRMLGNTIPVHARLRDFGTRAPGHDDAVACEETLTLTLV